MDQKIITGPEFERLANNFYNSVGLVSDAQRISVDAQLINYFQTHQDQLNKKYKVAFCCIVLNPQYWQYMHPMIEGAKRFFLPGHDVDFFMWSDFTKDEEALKKGEEHTTNITLAVNNPIRHAELKAEIAESFRKLREKELNATVFETGGIEWPMPTLMRYNLMLQQEEKLSEYDYIFYTDVDMLFVNTVGDEILGERLTAVQQPMYALRKEWWPPYEPNPQSASYIPRPGRVINDQGKPRFMPLYFAGGFQGGKAQDFISAMKVMKKKIDQDFNKNYVPIWNDETVWNSYLFENPDDRDVILTPSYTYPDSLIKEYFEPMWGCSYVPRLVTLTKKFSFQPGSGEQLQKTLSETSKLL